MHEARWQVVCRRRSDDQPSSDPWLDPGMRDVAAASELLKPYDARLMRCYPISTRINHVANDDAECSRPWSLLRLKLASSCSASLRMLRFRTSVLHGVSPHLSTMIGASGNRYVETVKAFLPHLSRVPSSACA